MRPLFYKIYILLCFIFPLSCFAQTNDQVLEVLDSLSNIYYFNKLDLEETANRYNYPAGLVPSFPDNVYVDRMNQLDRISPFDLVPTAIASTRWIRIPLSVRAATTSLGHGRTLFMWWPAELG